MTTQFRPDGAYVQGYWDDGEVAEKMFLGQVGLYGSGHAVVTLAETTADGDYTVIKSWSQQTSVVTGDVA
ncbi:hypothetical protein [Streptomyces violascens]|uniref:hypothetical protein n=1 Tax=Streptomyces violascens TaxID=67381 RepID=UPI001CFCBACD|nr:hypothetical protein [Streptomyces violascens]